VDDGGDAAHGKGELGDVGGVALNEFEIVTALEGCEGLVAVHEAVEDSDGEAGFEQEVDRMRSDVAGASDDEDWSALVDGDGGKGLVFAVGKVEEDAGEGKGSVGDERPEQNGGGLTEDEEIEDTRGDDCGEEGGRLDGCACRAEAGVNAEDPVADQEESREEKQGGGWEGRQEKDGEEGYRKSSEGCEDEVIDDPGFIGAQSAGGYAAATAGLEINLEAVQNKEGSVYTMLYEMRLWSARQR